MACQCDSGADEQIFLLHADGTDEHRILADVGGRQRHPDFSRDGQHLAFDRLENDESADEVWVADANGGSPTRVDAPCPVADCLGMWEPAWSPDGRSLAVIVEGGPFDPATETLDSFAVGVIDIATNTTTIVVSQPGLDGQLHFPRWSPDGRHLVFWNETDTPSVWIVDSDGTGLHQLFPPDLLAGDPDWSPDGARIVVSTRPLLHFDDGPSDLYTIAPDGSDLTRLTDSEASGVRYTQPRWTPDGTAIVYTRVADGRRTIWARTPDGSLESALGGTQPFQTHPVVRPAA